MKYEIEIEGLPEGWEPVGFRVPLGGEDIIDFNGDLIRVGNAYTQPRLIVRKKPPRRIVLEETGELRNANIGEWIEEKGSFSRWPCPKKSSAEYKIWREVKEDEVTDE